METQELRIGKADQVSQVLDENDDAIISALCSFIDKSFYENMSVSFELETLVKTLYPNQCCRAENCDDVIESLHRLARVRFTYEEPGKRRISFGVFDTVGEETMHQKKMFRVKFGEQLYHETLTRNTINVAKDSFEQLKNTAAKVLYPSLQRERINLTIKNQTVSDTNNRLVESYDHSFFVHSIFLNPKTKTKNLKLVREALDELVKYKLAIESYKLITKDKIMIFYFPLSYEERITFKIDTADMDSEVSILKGQDQNKE